MHCTLYIILIFKVLRYGALAQNSDFESECVSVGLIIIFLKVIDVFMFILK